jgi:hypothetical protein
MLLRRGHHLTRVQLFRTTFCTAALARTYNTASNGFEWPQTRTVAKPRAQNRPLESVWHQQAQRRGAKKKATLALNDLPQGALEGSALPPQDDTEPDYPPLLQEVRNNMLKFSHCVVVTRVGGFYEVRAYLPVPSVANKVSSTLSMPTSWLHS